MFYEIILHLSQNNWWRNFNRSAIKYNMRRSEEFGLLLQPMQTYSLFKYIGVHETMCHTWRLTIRTTHTWNQIYKWIKTNTIFIQPSYRPSQITLLLSLHQMPPVQIFQLSINIQHFPLDWKSQTPSLDLK